MGNWLYNLILFVNMASAVTIIVLVLLQHGKGADMGASFGSGASGSLFGATGAANLLSRATSVLAILFFGTCLSLALIAMKAPKTSESIMISDTPATNSAPAAAKPAITPPTGVVPTNTAKEQLNAISGAQTASQPAAPATQPVTQGDNKGGVLNIPK